MVPEAPCWALHSVFLFIARVESHSPELRADNVSAAAKAGHWTLVPHPRSHRHGDAGRLQLRGREETDMPNIFYIIGVVVVVFAILGYLGLR